MTRRRVALLPISQFLFLTIHIFGSDRRQQIQPMGDDHEQNDLPRFCSPRSLIICRSLVALVVCREREREWCERARASAGGRARRRDYVLIRTWGMEYCCFCNDEVAEIGGNEHV